MLSTALLMGLLVDCLLKLGRSFLRIGRPDKDEEPAGPLSQVLAVLLPLLGAGLWIIMWQNDPRSHEQPLPLKLAPQSMAAPDPLGASQLMRGEHSGR